MQVFRAGKSRANKVIPFYPLRKPAVAIFDAICQLFQESPLDFEHCAAGCYGGIRPQTLIPGSG
jgi:hypothetical protein